MGRRDPAARTAPERRWTASPLPAPRAAARHPADSPPPAAVLRPANTVHPVKAVWTKECVSLKIVNRHCLELDCSDQKQLFLPQSVKKVSDCEHLIYLFARARHVRMNHFSRVHRRATRPGSFDSVWGWFIVTDLKQAMPSCVKQLERGAFIFCLPKCSHDTIEIKWYHDHFSDDRS